MLSVRNLWTEGRCFSIKCTRTRPRPRGGGGPLLGPTFSYADFLTLFASVGSSAPDYSSPLFHSFTPPPNYQFTTHPLLLLNLSFSSHYGLCYAMVSGMVTLTNYTSNAINLSPTNLNMREYQFSLIFYTY